MPLIDIKSTPGVPIYSSKGHSRAGNLSVEYIARRQLGPSLPQLIADNWAELGLDEGTTAEMVQVCHDQYKPDDQNTAGLWIKVQFSEVVDDVGERKRIRDTFIALIKEWFASHEFALPKLAIDITFGPMHGLVMINGEPFEY